MLNAYVVASIQGSEELSACNNTFGYVRTVRSQSKSHHNKQYGAYTLNI